MRLLGCIQKENNLLAIIVGAFIGFANFVCLKKNITLTINSDSVPILGMVFSFILPFATLLIYAFIDSSGLPYLAISMTSVIIFCALSHQYIQYKTRKKMNSESVEKNDVEESHHLKL